MHCSNVGSVDALVDLCTVQTPGLHAEWHVLVAVVVMVEGRALCRRVEHAETNHRAGRPLHIWNRAAVCRWLAAAGNALSCVLAERQNQRGWVNACNAPCTRDP